MIGIKSGISIRGDISTAGDLTLEGRVDGCVWCEGYAVTIAQTARLEGEVFARDITVFGTVSGTLVASEVVDLRPESSVEGRVVSARFILTEGATFNGIAEPQQLEAAFRVARHRRLELAGLHPPRESADASPRRQTPRLENQLQSRPSPD